MNDIVRAAVEAQRGKRAKGFYWVQHNEGEWEIAHWGPSDVGDAPSWIIVGSDDRGDDSDMVEIDERVIVRPPQEGLTS